MGGDQSSPPSTPQTVFNIPTQGGGVSVTSGTDDDAKVVTVVRDVSAGTGPLTDIAVRDKASSTPAITSTVSVKKLPNGNVEYVETVHANKHFGADIAKSAADLRATIKAALPSRYQTTATIDKLTNVIAGSMIHVLFGPPEPLVADALIDPDLMAHKVISRAKKSLTTAIQAELPDITPEELKAIQGKVINDSNFSKSMTSPNSAQSNSDPNDLMPLTFTTSFNGKIVETNGLSDEDSGEVYWSLLAPTLEFGDVKLMLVVDPSGK
jgi:hypothetical protein